MFRQVGHLQLDENGIALQGLIIRHLVLPEGHAGQRETLPGLPKTWAEETHIALMNQYFPPIEAAGMPGINRKITDGEYAAAVEALEDAGLENGWVQDDSRCMLGEEIQ